MAEEAFVNPDKPIIISTIQYTEKTLTWKNRFNSKSKNTSGQLVLQLKYLV